MGEGSQRAASASSEKEVAPIDVSLLKVDDHFRAYYRVGKGGGLQWATSKNLTTWENQGKCPGANPEETRMMRRGLAKYDRPILCTEYLARANGSTHEEILPIFHQSKVGAYNWGLVEGKTNTIYSWNSWKKKLDSEPERWHRDVFRRDGTPYNQSEIDFIQ